MRATSTVDTRVLRLAVDTFESRLFPVTSRVDRVSNAIEWYTTRLAARWNQRFMRSRLLRVVLLRPLRQPNLERGPLTLFTAELDGTAVIFDDASADV